MSEASIADDTFPPFPKRSIDINAKNVALPL
jgi:hypothetical protein